VLTNDHRSGRGRKPGLYGDGWRTGPHVSVGKVRFDTLRRFNQRPLSDDPMLKLAYLLAAVLAAASTQPQHRRKPLQMTQTPTTRLSFKNCGWWAFR
jgi:hypothetical protein